MSPSPSSGGARLGDGMNVLASIRARLFGFRILELDADVTLTPQDQTIGAVVEARPVATRRSPATIHTGVPLPARNGRGPIGSGLEDVRRRLEAGATDLAEARRRMP